MRFSTEPLYLQQSRKFSVCRVAQAHRTSLNLHEPHHHRNSKVCRAISVCAGWLCTSSGWFKHIEPHRKPTRLLEPQHHRDSKVWRGLSHEFEVVRLYRTFSIYIIAGEKTRCAGCLCTSSGWFKHIEPHPTYSNHNITEIARCGEVCHMSSGWFNCTEPSLSTSLQGKQGLHGAYALVQGGSSTSNLIEPTRTTTSQR